MVKIIVCTKVTQFFKFMLLANSSDHHYLWPCISSQHLTYNYFMKVNRQHLTLNLLEEFYCEFKYDILVSGT